MKVTRLYTGPDNQSHFQEDGKVSQIIKGRSSRTDVIAMMGRPSGYYIYPLSKPQSGEAVVYSYAELSRSASGLKPLQKALVVTFDLGGVVTDVEYSDLGIR
jgi:outer membrane protein assembly factor BamE (lipoprotein component of BamABCDE complex)